MGNYRALGSVFLIAGTCIGAGMLALPVATAPIGFYLSLFLLIFVWALMSYTGLLVIEVNLWLPKNTSFISMAGETLGRFGKIIAWLFFMLMLYSLLAAYITGGGAIVIAAEKYFFGQALAPWHSFLPWIIVVSGVIYCGVAVSDKVNRFFFLGLIVAFSVLASSLTAHVSFHRLNGFNPLYIVAALPVLIASFGYHVILPSIRDYLGDKHRVLKWTVIFGGLVPLLLYIFWEFLIFGLVPIHGAEGLLAILRSGQPTTLLTNSLVAVTQNKFIAGAARFFVFFALASSFIGVALGLFDLLSDGLKIKKTKRGRLVLILFTFIPPFIYALTYPKGFILALSYAGVFVAILHGILPATMVWVGRYRLRMANGYRVMGGKTTLIAVFLLSLIVIYAQIGANFGWIPVFH